LRAVSTPFSAFFSGAIIYNSSKTPFGGEGEGQPLHHWAVFHARGMLFEKGKVFLYRFFWILGL
jgi:hypothetical protein